MKKIIKLSKNDILHCARVEGYFFKDLRNFERGYHYPRYKLDHPHPCKYSTESDGACYVETHAGGITCEHNINGLPENIIFCTHPGVMDAVAALPAPEVIDV